MSSSMTPATKESFESKFLCERGESATSVLSPCLMIAYAQRASESAASRTRERDREKEENRAELIAF